MDRSELFSLSESQQFLVLGETFTERSDLINMVGFHAYVKDCNLEALKKSWNRVLKLNDGLRIRVTGYGIRRQYFMPYRYEDYATVSVDGKEGFLALEKKERSRAVRLRKGALYRVTFIDAGDGCGGMIACLHDICCDGYSMELIFKQLEEFYACYCEDRPLPGVKREYSYKDYLIQDAKYKKSEVLRSDLAWWRKKYRSLRHYTIPCGRGSYAVETGMVIKSFEGGIYDDFVSLCESVGCTVNSALMSVMALTTWYLSKKKCFCFYSLSHGRRTCAMKQTVGCIVGMNPTFFQIDTSRSFRDTVSSDYLNYLESMQHGRLPFIRHFFLSYFQSLKLGLNFIHFWMFFSPMGFGQLSESSPLGLEVFDEGSMINPFYTAVYDLPEDHTLRLEMNYQLKKFTAGDMEHIKTVFTEVMNWCLAYPDEALSEMDAALPEKK